MRFHHWGLSDSRNLDHFQLAIVMVLMQIRGDSMARQGYAHSLQKSLKNGKKIACN